MQPSTCPNCGTFLPTQNLYCGTCGQNAHLHRIDFGYVLHEGAHFITHTDKSIFSLLAKLAYKPGHIARDFIGGQRKRYLGPLNFYLIVIGLFVFVLSTFKTFEQPNNFAQWRAGVQQEKDETKKQRILAKIERSEKAVKFISKYANFMNMLIATPLVSFLFFLFYRKHAYNYTEHLVANFYFAGFAACVFILVIVPVVAIFQNITVYLTAITCFLFFELLYKSVAYYQLINKRGIKPYLYSLMISALGVFGWVALTRWVITTYINTGFKFF